MNSDWPVVFFLSVPLCMREYVGLKIHGKPEKEDNKKQKKGRA